MSDLNKEELLAQVIQWLRENVSDKSAAISSETELIAQNLLDSMDLLRLVSHIEEAYGVSTDPDLLVPENFWTPARIVSFIMQMKASA